MRTTEETLREKELSLKIAVEENTELRKDYKELHENINTSRDELNEANMTVKEQKESFDRLLEVGKREAEVSKETFERTNTENKNEIDRLKKELEKKEIEVKKGLRDNNNERKLKAAITLEAKEAQVEHNHLKIKHKELKDELEAKKRALQDAQDHYQTITIDESKTNEQLREQVKNKDTKIKELEK